MAFPLVIFENKLKPSRIWSVRKEVMKVTIFSPKSEFSEELQYKLSSGVGEVVYTESRDEYPIEKLIKLCKDSEILAFDPDNIGGFEKTPTRLIKLLEAMPKIKGLALSTTAFGYIDKEYCKKRKIVVTNVPYYSTESVAEHTLGMILGCVKRIILTDRRTQKRKYRLEMGREFNNLTVGVIGLGHIGTRTAELCRAIGANVITWNRTIKRMEHVARKSTVEDLLIKADVVVLHLAENEETKHFLSKERIRMIKEGAIVINTADRSLVDEKAMAEALKSGRVDQYCFEGESLKESPLEGIETALLFKGFGWFTKEALEKNKEIWVNNIVGLAKGKPYNPIAL